MNEDQQTAIQTIREYQSDIESTKTNIKTMNEQVTELLEAKPAFAEVEEAQVAMKLAREKLKYSLMQDSDYNELMENIGQEKEKLKDQKDILSQHIVFYFKTTDEHQVPMDDTSGDAREIIVTGKLGKEGKYQTSIFSESNKSKSESEQK